MMGGIPDAKGRLAYNDGTGQAFTTQDVSEFFLKLGKGSKVAKKTIGMVGMLAKVWVKTDFTGLGSGVRLELVVDTVNSFDDDPKVVGDSGVLSLADLNATKPHQIMINPTRLEDYLTLADNDLYFCFRFSPVGAQANAGNMIVQMDDSPETAVLD